MQIQKKRNYRWWIVAGASLIVLAGLGIGTAIYLQADKNIPQHTAPVETPLPVPVSVSSNTLFFGNLYWGRYINEWSMKSPLKEAYPFSRLNEFKRDTYDAWIAGLECPTVANFTQTPAQEDATLSFNCSPNYLPEAAKWFTAFTLANNHTDNRGAAGFSETKAHLEENGIQYFGHYDPTRVKDACEVIALPVSVMYSDNSTKKQLLPVAFCAYHGVFQIPPEASLAAIEAYTNYMPVIAMPHMGAEYKAGPDQIKTDTYRAMIDYGADMVLGDHPHWVQNTEAYKGRLIAYSMGNFIFDQQGTEDLERSAAIRVVFSVMDAKADQLSDWLALGEMCSAFQDSCLAEAKAKHLTKLPFTYQFGVVGTNNGNKIVKPATKQQQASLLQRLQWDMTMQRLQPPYSSL